VAPPVFELEIDGSVGVVVPLFAGPFTPPLAAFDPFGWLIAPYDPEPTLSLVSTVGVFLLIDETPPVLGTLGVMVGETLWFGAGVGEPKTVKLLLRGGYPAAH
jgi:hypothetical protein